MNALLTFAWARLREPSSWAGIAAVLAATATQLPAEWRLTHAIIVASVIAGAVSFGLREGIKNTPIIKVLLLCGVAFLLAACTTTQASSEVTFQTLRVSANAYESLPLCPGSDPCADKGIVQKIHDGSETAYGLLLVARKSHAGDDIAAANQAVVTFSAIMNLPEIQAALAKKGQ
jgi:hypothetical protein